MQNERKGAWHRVEPRFRFGPLQFGRKAGKQLEVGEQVEISVIRESPAREADALMLVDHGALIRAIVAEDTRYWKMYEVLPLTTNTDITSRVIYQP